MSISLIAETPFVAVTYDDRGFLYVNWRGYVCLPDVQEGCEVILRVVKKFNCRCFINDNRELTGTWNQSLRWLSEDFMPRLVAAGLEKIAFIYSPDRSARYSLDRFLEMNDQFIGQTFEDYERAEQWLLASRPYRQEPFTPTPPGTGTLTIRTMEKHQLIDINDIRYLSSEKGDTLIHTRQDTFTSKATLKELMNQLPDSLFLQVHRSHIVNVREISSIKYYAGGSYHLFLRDLPKMRIPVSRSFAPVIKQRLGIHGKN